MEESRDKSGLSNALKAFNVAAIAGVAGVGLYTLAVSNFPGLATKEQAELVNDYMVPAFKGVAYSLGTAAGGVVFLWATLASCTKGRELPNEVRVTEESERLRLEIMDRRMLESRRDYRF